MYNKTSVGHNNHRNMKVLVGGDLKHIVVYSRDTRPPDKSEHLIFSYFST